jgi:hypothetical protein
MGEFQDAMRRDIRIRGFSQNTEKSYVSWVKDYTRFHRQPPESLSLTDVHR